MAKKVYPLTVVVAMLHVLAAMYAMAHLCQISFSFWAFVENCAFFFRYPAYNLGLKLVVANVWAALCLLLAGLVPKVRLLGLLWLAVIILDLASMLKKALVWKVLLPSPLWMWVVGVVLVLAEMVVIHELLGDDDSEACSAKKDKKSQDDLVRFV